MNPQKDSSQTYLHTAYVMMFFESTISNMAAVQIFEVMTQKCSVHGSVFITNSPQEEK
jgi:hypothetical protein